MPFVEVKGKEGAALFWQSGPIAVKFGMMEGLITTNTVLLLAGPPLTQEALLDITTLTWSLFANVELLNVLLFVPAGLPFTYHW